MSIDHGVYSSPESERPVFLDVAPGMTVVVKHDYLPGERAEKDCLRQSEWREKPPHAETPSRSICCRTSLDYRCLGWHSAGEAPTPIRTAGTYTKERQVIHCGGAARDPSMHNLFQIADVDSGVIRWVNADLVSHILPREPESR